MSTAFEEIMAQCRTLGIEPHISDDAVIYHGSATCNDWQNFVPLVVIHAWHSLSPESRLCAYLAARSSTMAISECRIAEQSAQLAAVTKERDELREIISTLPIVVESCDCRWCVAVRKARAALQQGDDA